jgi:ATP-dependent DNA ligase
VEGIVSKRRDAPYRSGRHETWIKLKCTNSDIFPIVAFVEKLGAGASATGDSSLLVRSPSAKTTNNRTGE